MHLTLVDIHRVRNLTNVTLLPAEGLNLIFGPNASGKTSLLEAIYLLSNGRSFRTTNIRSVVQQETETLQVFGKIKQEQTNSLINLGIEKGSSGTQIRINQNFVKQASQLAYYLPLQIINPEAHRLLDQGPTQRRKFLDWGLFHVEPTFHLTWQHYNRLLKQRNAALRHKKFSNNIMAWDQSLIDSAEKLTSLRQQYVSEITPLIQSYLKHLLCMSVTIEYRKGWNQALSFTEALKSSFQTDYQQGFTKNGPHRADIRLLEDGTPVQEKFSRGQQKLLVCALRLAQIRHLKNRTERSSIVLVDDLAAELDVHHRMRLLELLAETGAQLFVTVTEPDLIDTKAWLSKKMFHVEHGEVAEVV